MSIWEVVPKVTTPITLGAFLLACVAWLVRSWLRTQLTAMKHELDAIAAAPEQTRGQLLEVALGRYNVPVNDLPPSDRMQVHMELLKQRSERFRVTMLVFVVLATLALFAYFVTRSGGVKPRPTVVLMDSPLPDVVYSSERHKNGGTNADDLTDILKDLPIILVKETTSLTWHREAELISIHPALIVMHLSAFFAHSQEKDADEKFHSFVLYMSKHSIPFVVYTRPPVDPIPPRFGGALAGASPSDAGPSDPTPSHVRTHRALGRALAEHQQPLPYSRRGGESAHDRHQGIVMSRLGLGEHDYATILEQCRL